MTRRIVEETLKISIRTLHKLKIFDASAKTPLAIDGTFTLWITTELE